MKNGRRCSTRSGWDSGYTGSSPERDWAAARSMGSDASIVDGKIYVVMVDGVEVAARRIFEMGRYFKSVAGDGEVNQYSKSAVAIIGRVRWSFQEQ